MAADDSLAWRPGLTENMGADLPDGLYAIIIPAPEDPPGSAKAVVAGFIVENGQIIDAAPWLARKRDVQRWLNSRFCRRLGP